MGKDQMDHTDFPQVQEVLVEVMVDIMLLQLQVVRVEHMVVEEDVYACEKTERGGGGPAEKGASSGACTRALSLSVLPLAPSLSHVCLSDAVLALEKKGREVCAPVRASTGSSAVCERVLGTLRRPTHGARL